MKGTKDTSGEAITIFQTEVRGRVTRSFLSKDQAKTYRDHYVDMVDDSAACRIVERVAVIQD